MLDALGTIFSPKSRAGNGTGMTDGRNQEVESYKPNDDAGERTTWPPSTRTIYLAFA